MKLKISIVNLFQYISQNKVQLVDKVACRIFCCSVRAPYKANCSRQLNNADTDRRFPNFFRLTNIDLFLTKLKRKKYKRNHTDDKPLCFKQINFKLQRIRIFSHKNWNKLTDKTKFNYLTDI